MNANIVILLLLMVATACNRPQPKMSPIDMDRLREAAPGMTDDCARTIEVSGLDAMPDQTEQCFQMLAKQRWRGLWRNDFEGSIFCPLPATDCLPSNSIWLTPNSLRGDRGALYAIDFIGRRTRVEGHYGHLGGWAHEIVVDQPISIKPIIPAPPPLTKAELIAEWQRCEAEGNCSPSDEMRELMNGGK